MLTLKVVNAIFDSLAKKMAIKGNYVAISCFCLTCSFLTSYLCLCFAFFFLNVYLVTVVYSVRHKDTTI